MFGLYNLSNFESRAISAENFRGEKGRGGMATEGMFKYAVELAMMMHVTAASFRVDEDTLSRLRGKCVNDVKKLNGRITFDDAVKYQKGK